MTNRLSLLIVDADPVTTEGLRTLVTSREQWNILEARNTAEANTAAVRSRPDVVLVSHKPNYLDGVRVTHSLLSSVADLRVLLLCDDNTLAQRAFEAGVLGYLHKTQAQADLVFAINQLQQGRTFFMADIVRQLRLRYHHNPYPGEHQALTAREVSILQQIALSKTNKEIAGDLQLSVRTIEHHRANIMEKLACENLTDLVRYAIRTGLIEG